MLFIIIFRKTVNLQLPQVMPNSWEARDSITNQTRFDYSQQTPVAELSCSNTVNRSCDCYHRCYYRCYYGYCCIIDRFAWGSYIPATHSGRLARFGDCPISADSDRPAKNRSACWRANRALLWALPGAVRGAAIERSSKSYRVQKSTKCSFWSVTYSYEIDFNYY